MAQDYLSTNRTLWNNKIDVHLRSAFYDLDGFRAGKSSLQDIELEQLGDIRGKKVLHLQCHFGQDTLSLARLGAQVTGLDLSDKAIDAARKLARELNLEARFVCGDVFEADRLLEGETFDLIFTTYGVLGWLPELQSWGRVIGRLLRPGGELLLVEFHPVIWLFDDNFERVAYPYFNRGPIVEESIGTYADRDAPLRDASYSWPYAFCDIFSALLGNGMQIEDFREYDYSPYDCFLNTVPMEKGFQIRGMEGNMPMVFSVRARKR